MRTPKVKLPKKKLGLPKPQTKVLLDAYKRTVTGQTAARVAAFFEAIQWWDDAINYYLSVSPLNPDQVKQYEKANKVRSLAIGAGATDGERINALERVITLYEKIWETQKPPSLVPFLAKFNDQLAELNAREAKLAARFQLVTNILNDTFKPMGVEFAVTKSDVPRQFDGMNKILLSESLARVLSDKARKEGYLPVIFSEAPTVLKAASVERDIQGNAALNLQNYVKAVPAMLGNVLRFSGTVDRHKVFRSSPETLEASVGTVVSNPTVAPKEPRVVRPSTNGAVPRPKLQKGPLVGGKFKPGSAMATLYNMVVDGKVWPLGDVLSKLPVGDPMGRVKALQKIGADTKKWNVTLTKTTIQMEVA